MTAFALPDTAAPHEASGRLRTAPARLVRRAWEADRALVLFGLALAALALLAGLASLVDERTLRGVGVWTKPVKFGISLAVLAWTTAIVEGWLDATWRRRSRALAVLRGVLIAAATFEIVYITVQAALGQASHFNRGSTFHQTMYNLMGVGALALAATQPWLAVLFRRHAVPGLHPALREAVVVGLWLSFALGASAGVLMGGLQPPSNAGGLPFFGWTFGTGDLRPAHFVGSHAVQALPLVAALSLARGYARPTAIARLATAALVALFAVALVGALRGAVFN